MADKNPWIRRNTKTQGEKRSVINKIKKEGRIDGRFVQQITSLSLEEVIMVKLEQANRMFGGKLYGLPLMKTLPIIAKEAAAKYAISSSRSLFDAATFLGLNYNQFKYWVYKFNLKSYFYEEEDEQSSGTDGSNKE
jgi:hypothetical protein